MHRSTKKVIPKKRGRPATGRDPLIALRLPAELVKAVDKWAAKRGINRSSAIRQWIEIGLASAQGRATSADMAGQTIDH